MVTVIIPGYYGDKLKNTKVPRQTNTNEPRKARRCNVVDEGAVATLQTCVDNTATYFRELPN